MSCNYCNWSSSSLYSSEEIDKKDTPGWNPFEIIIKTITVSCEMKKDYSGLETFCGIMNIPEPINVKTFNDMQSNVTDAYVNGLQSSMTEATGHLGKDNIQEGDFEDSVANNISYYDTWQKTGHSSLNIAMTVIEAGIEKSIDYQFMSRHYEVSNSWEQKENQGST